MTRAAAVGPGEVRPSGRRGGNRVAPESRGGTFRVPATGAAIPARAGFFRRRVPTAPPQGVQPLCPEASTAQAVASSALFTATMGVYAMVSPGAET